MGPAPSDRGCDSVAFADVVDCSLHWSKVSVQRFFVAPTWIIVIPAVEPVQLNIIVNSSVMETEPITFSPI